MVAYIFWTGVELLKAAAELAGMTYQEINVYLFIVLHPLITLFFSRYGLLKDRENDEVYSGCFSYNRTFFH